MSREWILREDGALCLSGYPIRILNAPSEFGAFRIISDFHGSDAPVQTLAYAKMEAERKADEIDEFTPTAERINR